MKTRRISEVSGLSSVVLLVPSWGKHCGIAEYSRHVAQALRAGGHNVEAVSSIEAARILVDRDPQCRLIVQHDFGLFDSLEPQRCGPDTTYLLCDFIAHRIRLGQERPWVVMHTLDVSTPQRARKTDQIIGSGARVFSTNPSVPAEVGVEHLELGFTEPALRWTGGNATAESIKDLSCATFGFVNPAKGVSVVLAAARDCGFSLTAQWPTKSRAQRQVIQRVWRDSGIRGHLDFDFVGEERLMEIVSRCDFVFLPQRSVPYLAVSATVRLAVAMGIPVVTSSARQFEGLQDCTYVLGDGGLADAMNWISVPENRRELSERAIEHARGNSIRAVYERLFRIRQSVLPSAPDVLGSSMALEVLSQTGAKARWPLIPVSVKVAILRVTYGAELMAARLGLWPRERVLRRFGG